jgi:hypothetical protein
MWYKLAQVDFDEDDLDYFDSLDSSLTPRQRKVKTRPRKVKYYHGSSVKFKPGDELDPNIDKNNFNFSENGTIYLTSEPRPHYTVFDNAMEENWYIYEVLPTGKVFYSRMWQEYVTFKPCEIIKVVGSARGLGRGNPGMGKKSRELHENINFLNTDEDFNKQIKNRIENIERLNDIIKEGKEALTDPDKRKEFIEFWDHPPEKMIQRWEAQKTYIDKKVSYAPSRWYKPNVEKLEKDKEGNVDPWSRKDIPKIQGKFKKSRP